MICPLGKECNDCAWYIPMNSIVDGKEVTEKKCVTHWLPILSPEQIMATTELIKASIAKWRK